MSRRLRHAAARILTFVTPVPDWRDRVADRAAGRITWPAPLPGKHALGGFPLEWILAVADAGMPTGLRYPEKAACFACSKAIKDTKLGVRCARCGVALHPTCAGMQHAFSTPSCRWCRGASSAA